MTPHIKQLSIVAMTLPTQEHAYSGPGHAPITHRGVAGQWAAEATPCRETLLSAPDSGPYPAAKTPPPPRRTDKVTEVTLSGVRPGRAAPSMAGR